MGQAPEVSVIVTRKASIITVLAPILMSSLASIVHSDESLRAGIIGCDTSHVPAFTEMFNGTNANLASCGVKVVSAYPGGSDDIPKSRDRVEGFTEELRKMGIEIVSSVEELVRHVDVVLLMSIDGRTHRECCKLIFEAGKPVYIDKPFAGSLVDAVAIVEMSKEYDTPFFSSSALRYEPEIFRARSNPTLGKVEGCIAFSPCKLEPTHPDLFWYGIHGVETLYTIMGPGCESVTRAHTENTDSVTGVWKDGRLGSFRGQRVGPEYYGAIVFGLKSIKCFDGFGGYEPLVMEIAEFFKTRKSPVTAEETLEIYAFMEAADESKRKGGVPIAIKSVIDRARREFASQQR